MNKIRLVRVEYGKRSTPPELREYRINNRGSVGCLSEFKKEFPNAEFVISDINDQYDDERMRELAQEYEDGEKDEEDDEDDF